MSENQPDPARASFKLLGDYYACFAILGFYSSSGRVSIEICCGELNRGPLSCYRFKILNEFATCLKCRPFFNLCVYVCIHTGSLH